ncbi:BTB/POZ domain-containing protein [Verticillium dahliae VdLs.17]|uniref:BTB/POZ domain-containing protein n=1 Tax=Verticillium dahliae (strain VdLs.17 / ATCC MYA-4575 / FGSC 10137) TaxID=498257 RepID=G2X4V6_VERDV|nr:BTB/POZ domain-containing protein [Verticillium dahliae VdLs.17]EGY23750.1 BTB/POZ domain-containing protein [Verticillium dahliae VdLs.17]KAF3351639.1 hypothetical protein VdG2_00216 [Verticillium dahliae VDG2]
MEVSRDDRIRVYRSTACRRVFGQYENSCLRKQKAIRKVVEANYLQVATYSDDELVRILQDLLADGIFISDSIAQRRFPDLFKETKPTPPVATPVMAIVQKDQADCLSEIQSLLLTGEHSDLTISTSKGEYQVHRLVVCSRSRVFATKCSPQWHTQGEKPSISLVEDDPTAVDCMVQYFYKSNYDTTSLVLSDESSPSGRDCLMHHAKIFALAEMYSIEGLKALSLAKFKELTSSSSKLCHDEFFSVAEYVYTSTVEAVREMRDTVVKVLYANPKYLDLEVGKTTMMCHTDLVYDLLLHVRARGHWH